MSDEHLALNLPTQNLAKNLSAEQDYEIATISNRQSVKISELYNNNKPNFDLNGNLRLEAVNINFKDNFL